MSESAFELALGLRYGLVGVAGAHHVVLSADAEELEALPGALAVWSDLVEEHARETVEPKLRAETRDAFSIIVADYAQKPLSAYLALQQQLYPFEYYLEIVLSLFLKSHRGLVVKGVPFLKRPAARNHFHETSRSSLGFAVRFFERREADLEEVPEIVLLGE